MGSEAKWRPGEVMPRVRHEKGTLSPSLAQGAVSLQVSAQLCEAEQGPGAEGCPTIPKGPSASARPSLAGAGRGGQRLKTQWLGWGQCCKQQFPTYPPCLQAKSYRQVVAPREVLYSEQQEGRAQHFVCPQCHGVGFPVAAGRKHRHRPGAETSSSPPSPCGQ